ncbi:MAG TPA: hypothetical protein VEQ87_04150 [Burkholderiales bacterium]|nr:hypothetical protein [Burkholderiales bacterium]
MRIERLIPCPPDKLWQALIRHAEATERGVMLVLPGGLPDAGKITRYDSRKLLECRGHGSVVRWELAPRAEGMTLLAVTCAPDDERWLGFLDSITCID